MVTKHMYVPNTMYNFVELLYAFRSTMLHHMYTTPSVVYEIRSEQQALYLYLLFALLDPHVGVIHANFSSGIFNAFATLEMKLPQLTTDIELGRIDPDLKIDQTIRKKLNNLLIPNPKRANEIRQAAEMGKDNLAQRIWPDLCLLIAADTGTFDLYATRLRESYCKGIVSFCCSFYKTLTVTSLTQKDTFLFHSDIDV